MRSIREYVGVDEFRFGEIVAHVLTATVLVALLAAITSSIVFGMLIYYNHINHMTDQGYVYRCRRVGEGLTSKDVWEWVKEDQKEKQTE